MEYNTMIEGDAAKVLKESIPDNSIDLVVTSPPYDNLCKYNGSGEGWNHEKFKEIANELARVLKQGGVIVWNVNDKIENGSKTGTSFRQALYFMELGSGTTALAAIQLKRNYIGIDSNKNYVYLAKERIENEIQGTI